MIIYIKKLKQPIVVDKERGEKIKEMWLNSDLDRRTVIDLGAWAGQLREISSIVDEAEETSIKPFELKEEEPTPNEREKNKERLARMKLELSEKLGWK